MGFINVLFMLIVIYVANGQTLEKVFSAGVQQCLEDQTRSGWVMVLSTSFPPFDLFPQVEDRTFPRLSASLATKLEQNVNICFYEKEAHPHVNFDGKTWSGTTVELLKKCIIPKINQHYTISLSPNFMLVEKAKILPDGTFDEFLVHVLETSLCDVVQHVPFFQRRVDMGIVYGQSDLKMGFSCIRTKYDRSHKITTSEDINKGETIVSILAGASANFMRSEFPKSTIYVSDHTRVLYSKLTSPDSHLVCAETPLLSWFKGVISTVGEFLSNDIIGAPFVRYGQIFGSKIYHD